MCGSVFLDRYNAKHTSHTPPAADINIATLRSGTHSIAVRFQNTQILDLAARNTVSPLIRIGDNNCRKFIRGDTFDLVGNYTRFRTTL